ncbi:hypothetical protein [Streptomyces sp. NPDC029526]|uniref:hypothetical protein n=1 Tax=Streptomyces sp. NPDC029526 TaxID=3155728 RepID=UPI0033FDD8F4
MEEFTQQAGPFTDAQQWWIEKIADATAATETDFAPKLLEGFPFSARGGTFGFLHDFGREAAINLLDELRRALA